MSFRKSGFSKSEKNRLINLKGCKCINCEKECGNEIVFHHIVPLSIGGNDIDTNIVPLCSHCHSLLHGIESSNGQLSHSKIIKAGIQYARKQGIKIGRPEVSKEDVPKQFYKYVKGYQDKTLNITNASRIEHVSRTTFYKYMKLLTDQSTAD